MEPGTWVTVISSLLGGIMLLVSYVSNDTFPPPLSDAEEREQLKLLAEKDKNARQVLIERNLRLVAHMIKKFDNTGEDPEDLISIGTIGLIKAINTYDGSKKTRLATYAAKCIENEILMFLRASKKSRGEVLLYDPIGVDKEGNEINLIDVLYSENNEIPELVEAKLERAKILEVIKNLNNKERVVIELRYGVNTGIRKTQREIAKLLGISRSYVSRIEKRALQKLSKILSLEGYLD
jgi:RNA polymerase sporulation-specific sigma factor